jgi:hypothetical protein
LLEEEAKEKLNKVKKIHKQELEALKSVIEPLKQEIVTH